jgi:hypothetical protein
MLVGRQHWVFRVKVCYAFFCFVGAAKEHEKHTARRPLIIPASEP